MNSEASLPEPAFPVVMLTDLNSYPVALEALRSGAVLSLTHELEIEVGEMLCQALPGAEMVLFGKNGSDICSAAVRLAV